MRESLALRVDFGLSINHSIRRVKPPLRRQVPFPNHELQWECGEGYSEFRNKLKNTSAEYYV